jgi:hypothetical protein
MPMEEKSQIDTVKGLTLDMMSLVKKKKAME